MRHVGNGLHVCRDVLSFISVPARGCFDEHAIIVPKRNRQSVDFGLGGDLKRRLRAYLEKPPHPGDEFDDLIVGERIAERQHGDAVPDLAELLERRGPDLRRRAFRAGQVREALLDRFKAQPQCIVVGVRNDRRVLLVIEPVVLSDFLGEPFRLRLGLRLAEFGRVCWRFGSRHRSSALRQEALGLRAGLVRHRRA